MWITKVQFYTVIFLERDLVLYDYKDNNKWTKVEGFMTQNMQKNENNICIKV